MPDSANVQHGRCHCGNVDYTVTGPLRDVVNCHCDRCRRITGHHMAASAAAVTDIEITDTSTLRWYQPADDPTVGYAFCTDCGSSLFWRSSSHAAQWSICAGTLDPPTGLSTAANWFADRASDYHHLDADVASIRGDGAGG